MKYIAPVFPRIAAQCPLVIAPYRLNRVTADTINLGNSSYQYDAGGNRTQRVWRSVTSLGPDTQTLTYGSTANRLSSNGATTIGLDAAGNLTSRGSLTYAYNNANKLVSYMQSGSVAAIMQYNALGQRVTKGAVSYPLSFHYGLRGELLGFTAYTSSGVLFQQVDYVWLDDTPIAQNRTTYASDGTVSVQRFTYIHADHLNTPRAMSDSTGKLVWRWDGDAYGSMPPNQNPDGDAITDTLSLRYPGQFYDQETELYYNVNRYYDPAVGRYTQFDLIGPARDYSNPILQVAMKAGLALQGNRGDDMEGDLNLDLGQLGLNQPYAYAKNSPLRYIDPFGLSVETWDNSVYPATHNCSCNIDCQNNPDVNGADFCKLVKGKKPKIGGVEIPINVWGELCQKVTKWVKCDRACSDSCSGKCNKSPF